MNNHIPISVPEAIMLNNRWINSPTSEGQREIERHLRIWHQPIKSCLLVGIGNCNFSPRCEVLDGITLYVPEYARAQQINKRQKYNYRHVFIMNKYDIPALVRLSVYYIIVDVNPKSYSCCEAHFLEYFHTILNDHLYPGGHFFSHSSGMAYAVDTAKPMTTDDLKLPKNFHLTWHGQILDIKKES